MTSGIAPMGHSSTQSPARDAGVLVHDLSDAADHFEHFLRAGIDADAATDALIGFDNRVRHS